MEPQDLVSQAHAITIKDGVNATKVYKTPGSMEQYHERHHHVTQKNADKAEKLWAKITQFREMNNN